MIGVKNMRVNMVVGRILSLSIFWGVPIIGLLGVVKGFMIGDDKLIFLALIFLILNGLRLR